MVVIVAVLLAELLPDADEDVLVLVVLPAGGAHPALFACVVMDVEDGVHAVIHRIIHNSFHAVQPFTVDLMGLGIHVVVPRHRDTDGVKARLVNLLDQLPGNRRIAPQLLRCHAVHSEFGRLVAVKGVAKIPADGELLNGTVGGQRHVLC